MDSQVSRHSFYLKALQETSAELSALVQPRRILETFLLMSMGSLGLRCGYVVVFDIATRSGTLVCRGIDAPAVERLKANWSAAFNQNAPASANPLVPTLIRSDAPGVDATDWPPDITGLILWQLNDQYAGLCGLGATLDGQSLSADGAELMMNLVIVLSGALAQALNIQHIRTLDADLKRKQSALQQALEEADDTRSNLNKAADQLKAAYQRIDILEHAKTRLKMILERESKRADVASWFDFVIIGSIALILGLLFNYFSPNGIDLLPERFFHPPAPVIEVSDARTLRDAGALIIDARPQAFFDQKHIAGALNLTPALFDIAYTIKLGQSDLERPMIVYGRSISRHYDEIVARRLLQRDHRNVAILAGGLSAWETKGYAIEP